MQKLDNQTLFGFAAKVKHNNGAAKPVKCRFHTDGSVSIRVNGRWHHDQQLDHRLFLSLPGATRQAVMRRIITAEYRNGRQLITGSKILVSKLANNKPTERGN
jgi:hypothetical protein